MRTIVGVDGEHHPEATRAALAGLKTRGLQVVGGIWLGGTEKADATADFGVEIVSNPSAVNALIEAIATHKPDLFYELSDEPTVTADSRLALASVALAKGVEWRTPGARLTPPPRPRLSRARTVAVIATGKRVGKTAVSQALAKHAVARGMSVTTVAMGRGGPAQPIVVAAGEVRSIEDLVAVAESGRHAASDYLEDALVTGIRTIGTRRVAGGLLGEVELSSVEEAVRIADDGVDLVIVEGSGACVPPCATDATLLCVPADLPPRQVGTGLGTYRPLISTAALVLGPESGIRTTLTRVNPDLNIVSAEMSAFRVNPTGDGTAILATTAPDPVSQAAGLDGLDIVGCTGALSDRTRLIADLEAMPPADVLAVEVKGAAVDTAVRWALGRGMRVEAVANTVAGHQIDDLFDQLIGHA